MTGSALDDVNERFHIHYDAARDEAKLEAPVFVVCADVLTVFRGTERTNHPFSPPIYHVIKSVAHAPVALFAAFQRQEIDAKRLDALAARVKQSLAELEREHPVTDDVVDDLRAILCSTLAFAEQSTKTRPTTGALKAFGAEQGPLLLRLTEAATRVELKALDECVEQELAKLTKDERARLEVVVTGDHQARNRSLGMQYFQKRFGEEPGAEERVAYGEGIEDADEAHALVGTRRLDNAVADAFFGDPKRLQRDVLGDAVHALLAKSDLSPIR